MDVSSAAWLSELELMEDCDFKNPHEMANPFMDAVAALSSESLTDYPNYLLPTNQSFQPGTSCIEQDVTKQPKNIAISNNRMTNPFAPSRVSSSNTFIMSFGNPNSPPEINPHHIYDGSNLKYSGHMKTKEEKNTNDFLGSLEGAKRVLGASRNETQAQDHVLAERKRREVLTRRFIALSALLPNLKKMDKATVLEDATKYIKQLQTRMKELEEQTSSKNKRFKQESAISIRRSKISGDNNDDTPSSDDDETGSSPNGDTFNPEIEVRISERSVLVRIYSQKNSSVAMKTLSEMERLHLTIGSSSVMPFSSTALLITITAQMSEKCDLTAMDVVKRLQSAIRSYI
ncbi:unnamed protein product [Lactuca virosa]|uniref:BHLH domain-containing protein n=1 Tax=Lactuca virosa TaxID=75947 RepID=A0AAU9LUU7_9ASTR|nr:unnamed protein product [Lactuca virosa]